MATALIVDDHPEALYLLRCVLEPEGFTVVEAGNGREALERAAEHAPSIVVSDILMPVMDGFTLCRTWKSDPTLRETPFVFYTATYVDRADEELGLSLGADLFLVKPMEPQVFVAKVRELLVRRQQGRHADVVPPDPRSVPFLRQYNAVLVHKLEDKLEQLERANQALRLKDLALASSRNGIVLASERSGILYANDTMLRLCGRPAEELLGRPVEGLLPGVAGFAAWVGRADSAPLEIEWSSPEGSPGLRWLRLEKHAVRDSLGDGQGFMLSCADVTQEVRLRHDLTRIQRFEALSLFAAGIAHDFNNLLMALFSALEIDRSERITPEERNENRGMALAAFERARGLVRRLVSFAKCGPSERRSADLRQLLDESIALALSGSEVKCERRYCDRPAVARVDAGQMAQVFGNLLLNARQAMRDRGDVVVEVRQAAADSSSSDGPGATLVVTITDDGPGIAAEIMPNLFEPYFTTKEEGTGLGLATSRAIVVEHGGQISIRSRPGAGTTCEVVLPAAPGAAPAAAPARSEAHEPRAGRILVMDGQTAILAMLRRGLERAGYVVVTAKDTEEAARELRRAKKEGAGFDLMVLHVRADAAGDVLAELRRLDDSVRAIATTDAASQASADALLAAGFAGVVHKPLLLHELFATIRAALTRR